MLLLYFNKSIIDESTKNAVFKNNSFFKKIFIFLYHFEGIKQT